MADAAPAPDEAAATAEEAALVRASLAKLPETYRLPLVLYYREGQSVRAVAETLGLSEDAVKQRLARGREMLRDRMLGTRRDGPGPHSANCPLHYGRRRRHRRPGRAGGGGGGVFTAASAAGTSTAASSTSALLTAMSTSKAVLVTATLAALVCVPVGYHLTHGSRLARRHPDRPGNPGPKRHRWNERRANVRG